MHAQGGHGGGGGGYGGGADAPPSGEPRVEVPQSEATRALRESLGRGKLKFTHVEIEALDSATRRPRAVAA